jgi:hypothetical protein
LIFEIYVGCVSLWCNAPPKDFGALGYAITHPTYYLDFFRNQTIFLYALIKFTAKDYIKQSQINVFLESKLAKLTVNLKLPAELEQKIKNHEDPRLL